MVRGIRNNNPGNIRLSGDKWEGLSATQSDPSFFQFASAEYGIRALAKILKTYRDTYGLTTVSEIITRWAPPTENDTRAYITAVAADMQVDPNSPLDFSVELAPLVSAIIKHENGINPYSYATVATGVSMAA